MQQAKEVNQQWQWTQRKITAGRSHLFLLLLFLTSTFRGQFSGECWEWNTLVQQYQGIPVSPDEETSTCNNACSPKVLKICSCFGWDLRRILAKFRYQIFDLLRRISFNRQEVQSYPFKTETKGKFLMLPLLYVKSIFRLFSQYSTLGIVHAWSNEPWCQPGLLG